MYIFGRSTTATNSQLRASDLPVHVFNQTACDDDDVFRNLGHFFDAHVNHSSERDLKYVISNASVCMCGVISAIIKILCQAI